MDKKNSNTLTNLVVVKRSGQRVNFNGNKIAIAIKQAFDTVFEEVNELEINKIYENVLKYIDKNYKDRKTINVEDIQDIIEEELKNGKYLNVYEHFASYRQKRSALRKIFEEKQEHKFAKAVEKLSNLVKNNEQNFSNNIIDKFGKTISKEYAKSYVLENKFIKLLEEGIIVINNLDEYVTYKTANTHLDFSSLVANNMEDYTNTMIKTISNCKKEQYGEHTIPALDYIFVNIIIVEFKNILKNNLKKYLKVQGLLNFIDFEMIENNIENINTIYIKCDYFEDFCVNRVIKNIFEIAIEDSLDELKDVVYKNLKKLIMTLEENHFNTSISLGSNYNSEEAVLLRVLYLKIISELDRFVFVNTIYKIYNVNEEELNIILDLIKKGKNIFLLFEKDLFDDYKNELEVFSTGEKIFDNVINENKNSIGRILLSTTSVNLARLGLEFKDKDISLFYNRLSDVLEIVKNQLVHRFELQGSKYKEDYKYLFQNNVVYENSKLENNQKIRKVIRNGALNISLVGLYECSILLTKKNVEKLAYEILDFIKIKIAEFISEEKLNFIISESYDGNILNEFISIDKSIYGKLPVLNKSKYDNFSKIYDNLEIEERVKKLGKYQENIASVVSIDIPKCISNIEFINLINILQKANIIFCKMEVKE